VSIGGRVVRICTTPVGLITGQIVESVNNRLIAGKLLKRRSIKWKVRKAKLWSLTRIGLIVLPTMTIPFCELSLTGLLSFPVFIPSPIGMELVEVSTSLLHSTFSLSSRIR
jgi:hypothetical protein